MMTTNEGIRLGNRQHHQPDGTQPLRLVDFNIPDTAQEDQETAPANLYFASVDVPFTRNDLEPGAVTITTAGKTNGCRQRCSSSASTASARGWPPSLRRWSTSGTGSWGR
jgi:hypothetical protein